MTLIKTFFNLFKSFSNHTQQPTKTSYKSTKTFFLVHYYLMFLEMFNPTLKFTKYIVSNNILFLTLTTTQNVFGKIYLSLVILIRKVRYLIHN
jgi:hypothetical protein